MSVAFTEKLKMSHICEFDRNEKECGKLLNTKPLAWAGLSNAKTPRFQLEVWTKFLTLQASAGQGSVVSRSQNVLENVLENLKDREIPPDAHGRQLSIAPSGESIRAAVAELSRAARETWILRCLRGAPTDRP